MVIRRIFLKQRRRTLFRGLIVIFQSPVSDVGDAIVAENVKI